MRTIPGCLLSLLLAGCVAGPPGPFDPVPGDGDWRLVAMNGRPFAARATLRFETTWRIAGHSPCNLYSAKLTAPPPDFTLVELTATEMACPELDAEGPFFETLLLMTHSETAGDTLTMTGPAGRSMVFRRP